jgi:hypothetical protein
MICWWFSAGSSSDDAPGRVYLLWHVDLTGGEEDAKLIGVYSTGDLAEMAARRLSSQPGFVDLPAMSSTSRLWQAASRSSRTSSTATIGPLAIDEICRSTATASGWHLPG